jgi:hypothetical protein
MGKYAAGTTVPSYQRRLEIERTLERYGATAFAYGKTSQRVQVMFEIADRRYRMDLPMPDRNADNVLFTPAKRYQRSVEEQERVYEQMGRQRWAALSIYIKAVLEAAESGITTVEEALLSHVMLPNGSTVGEWAGKQLHEVYASGQMPELLPGGER